MKSFNKTSLSKLEGTELWPTLLAELENDSVHQVAQRHELPPAAIRAALRRTGVKQRRVRVVRPEFLRPDVPEEEAEATAAQRSSGVSTEAAARSRKSARTRSATKRTSAEIRTQKAAVEAAEEAAREKALQKKRAAVNRAVVQARVAARVEPNRPDPATETAVRRMARAAARGLAQREDPPAGVAPVAGPATGPSWAFSVALDGESEPRWVIAATLQEASGRAEAAAPGRVVGVTRVAPMLG